MIIGSPKVFISYSWDDDAHREWVRRFASRLHADGIRVILDQWNLAPGEQLSSFMEQSIRDSAFVLYICTPRYKERSDHRDGGAGFEGDIMTGEVFVQRNQRKFIPILRKGEWKDAAPSWSAGKYYIDLRGDPYSEQNYRVLLLSLRARSEEALPVGGTSSEISVGAEDTEFVNREIELATLEKLHDSYWQCALITAPTGYGKSRLLKRLIYRIQNNDELRRKSNYRYVDLSKCDNPDDVKTYLWEQVCEKKWTSAYSSEEAARRLRDYVLNEMSKTVKDGPMLGVLLIIDAVETVPLSNAEWLFRVFHDIVTGSYIDYEKDVASFPVRLVLSGTNAEAFWSEYKKWERTSGRKRFLRAPHVLELSALKKEHVEELIGRRAKNREMRVNQAILSEIADKLLYLSGGHPAVINGILDELFEISLRDYDDYLRTNRQGLIQKYVSRVSQKILDHFPLSQAQRDIKTICVFRLISLKTLNELLAADLITSQADINLLASLCSYKILKPPSPEKFFYHDDIIRRILYLDLSFRNVEDIEHVQKTHECARDLYGKLIESNLEHYMVHYFFVEWLFHALQVNNLDANSISSEWKSMLAKIQPVSIPIEAHIGTIRKMLQNDSEVQYLYRERFAVDDFAPLFEA